MNTEAPPTKVVRAVLMSQTVTHAFGRHYPVQGACWLLVWPGKGGKRGDCAVSERTRPRCLAVRVARGAEIM